MTSETDYIEWAIATIEAHPVSEYVDSARRLVMASELATLAVELRIALAGMEDSP